LRVRSFALARVGAQGGKKGGKRSSQEEKRPDGDGGEGGRASYITISPANLETDRKRKDVGAATRSGNKSGKRKESPVGGSQTCERRRHGTGKKRPVWPERQFQTEREREEDQEAPFYRFT